MRRIERLINLIAALLETSRPLTAEEIRKNVAGYDQANKEAFRRAFERDKEELRLMGIPLELRSAEDDPFAEQLDAYIIPKDKYYLPEIDLEADEVASLRLAAGIMRGGGSEMDSALLKLSMEGPSPTGGSPLSIGADMAVAQPHLGPLYGALLEKKPVRFRYAPANGEERERDVEPYRLIHRRGNWYLVGFDRGREAIRSFKVRRITTPKIKLLDGSYDIPSDLNLEEHLPADAFEIGADEPEEAVVRFSAALRWWPEQNMPSAPREDGPEGSVDVRVPVSNLSALVSWVLNFGREVRIIGPDSARQGLIQHLGGFLDGQA